MEHPLARRQAFRKSAGKRLKGNIHSLWSPFKVGSIYNAHTSSLECTVTDSQTVRKFVCVTLTINCWQLQAHTYLCKS